MAIQQVSMGLTGTDYFHHLSFHQQAPTRMGRFKQAVGFFELAGHVGLQVAPVKRTVYVDSQKVVGGSITYIEGITSGMSFSTFTNTLLDQPNSPPARNATRKTVVLPTRPMQGHGLGP